MAQGTFFKRFTDNDKTTTRTLLHEAIPITGTLVSGTYNPINDPGNGASWDASQKNHSHGMFVSFYDYPYLSSSANHIFDVTCGVSPTIPSSSSGFQGTFTGSLQMYNQITNQRSKKINMYNQMALQLVGNDTSGSIRYFDRDGDLSEGDKILDPIFVSFSRLLTKDEIKKGSFEMIVGTDTAWEDPFDKAVSIKDTGADTNYKINSPAGEYAILYASEHRGDSIHASATGTALQVGLIYYQAGIVVLDSSALFHQHAHPSGSEPAGRDVSSDGILNNTSCQWTPETIDSVATPNISATFFSGTIEQVAGGLRRRIENISFNNTTELYSTIYFARANHNEYNYSANSTYLSQSKIVVKGNNIQRPPRAYITTVGLYSADNELLAVAKLSEPLRKTPSVETTLRVRLDY